MTDIVKTEFYDSFQCIADRCPFTCCQGWEIHVDPETYRKLQDVKSTIYTDGIFLKKQNKKPEYFLKMCFGKYCTFLDDKGLCNIVKEHGDGYLPKTCREFPRQINSFAGKDEYSLTCACPVVLDYLYGLNRKLDFDFMNEIQENKSPFYMLRAAMIKIMQNTTFAMKEKILIIFQMLLSVREDISAAKDIIDKFLEEDYQAASVDYYKEIAKDIEGSYLEINELFLDITINYRNEKSYSHYLKDIYKFAESMKPSEFLDQRDQFHGLYDEFRLLIENVLVLKIFADCCVDDIDEMILSFQRIIIEYVMIEHSVYLNSIKNGEINMKYEELRDYIVVYSRIIGYNEVGMREFWTESFDEPIWDLGYLILLMS